MASNFNDTVSRTENVVENSVASDQISQPPKEEEKSDKKSKKSESKEDPNDLGEWEEKVKEAGALPGKANVRHKAHPFGDRTKHRYLTLIFRFDSGKMFESTSAK